MGERPSAPAPPAAPMISADIRWPHMADNIFLGLTTLFAAHWLAMTLPAGSLALFQIAALVVALPFGYRFERNSRTGTAGQVIAALAFGSIGTLSIGMLDAAVGGRTASAATAQDIAASVATIALSHYAGSALAHLRQVRTDRRAAEDAAARLAAPSATDRAGSLMHIEPARIKGTAEVVKAVYDAAAPVAAGAAALWAALGHVLF